MLASMRVEYDFRMQVREWGKVGRKSCLGDWARFECGIYSSTSVKEIKRRVLVKRKGVFANPRICVCAGGGVLLPKFCLALKIDDLTVLRIVAHLILGKYKLRRKSLVTQASPTLRNCPSPPFSEDSSCAYAGEARQMVSWVALQLSYVFWIGLGCIRGTPDFKFSKTLAATSIASSGRPATRATFSACESLLTPFRNR